MKSQLKAGPNKVVVSFLLFFQQFDKYYEGNISGNFYVKFETPQQPRTHVKRFQKNTKYFCDFNAL